MVVTLLLLVPLLSATVLLAMPTGTDAKGTERWIGIGALIAAVVTAGLAVVVVAGRLSVDVPWIRSLGIRWHFAVDGISAALVLFTGLLVVAVVLHALAAPTPQGGSRSTYFGCILLVEAGALATFLARDALLFFIAFEVVLVPMWLLIRRFGDEHVRDTARADASGRFILFTAFGSTLMLIGILFLVAHQGTSDLTVLGELHGKGLSRSLEIAIAAILLTGLAVKVPLWPLHTWLPSAHTIAPTAGSVLLAAILLKMGTYGIVRLAVAAVPDGVAALSPVLAILGAVGTIWGGLACLVERDLKRLIAYSSVAHMGFIAIAIASGSHTGLQAALFANIAHGIVAALLFFLVGDLKEQWGSADLTVPRVALRDRAPRFGIAFVFGLAAVLGLPGLVSFWGEFLALYAAWSPAQGVNIGVLRATVVVGAFGLALAAAYALRVARILWAGEGAPETDAVARDVIADERGIRWGVVVSFIAVMLALGVVPHLLLNISDLDAAALLSGVTR
jgi:NADH-quinone oxidoreductase subunit M